MTCNHLQSDIIYAQRINVPEKKTTQINVLEKQQQKNNNTSTHLHSFVTVNLMANTAQ